MTDVNDLLETWLANATDSELAAELARMKKSGDATAVNDAFYQDLEFGTAGLRGVIGAGTNRMNVYTVGRATQGFADYLNAHFESPSVAIARDSRHKGEEFVRHAAEVLAANGIVAHLYPRIEPTPALSFAVRDLGCSGGICMTASHNPAPYNGYKAYGPDGCQITTQAAHDISEAIAAVDTFSDVKALPYDEAVERGLIRIIEDDTLERFIDAVCELSAASPEDAATELSVVYTPLHGAGLECVSAVLERGGIANVTVVPRQDEADGDFPTCPYPNPEIREALELGIEVCRREKPDLLLATDPDADRVGIAVADKDDYTLLTGNEVGVLLLDYLARCSAERGEDLNRRIAVTTIVSSMMVDALAARHGFEVRRVLTGFKYIGDIIGQLERAGETDRFLFGFEESYGYLSGSHVRDKDAVNASLLICQMARYYKRRGMSLVEAMRALYQEYGFYRNKTFSLSYPGADGSARMRDIMQSLRTNAFSELGGCTVERVVDYAGGMNGLPAANVVEFGLAGENKLIVRPSGTEPKIKAYLFAKGATDEEATELLARLETQARGLLA